MNKTPFHKNKSVMQTLVYKEFHLFFPQSKQSTNTEVGHIWYYEYIICWYFDAVEANSCVDYHEIICHIYVRIPFCAITKM